MLQAILAHCMRAWVHEHKGDEIRWRGVGCGERSLCPVCGSYRQQVLANEGAEAMLKAMAGLEVSRLVTPANLGWKIVLTIPKDLSEWLDGLLRTDSEAWQKEVNKLFRLSYRWVENRFGKGCGGVVGIHYNGDSEPSAAHYHMNVYVFPGRRGDDGWIPLPGFLSRQELDWARESWKGLLNGAYHRQLKEVNVNVGFCGGEGKLRHWLTYLMKHQLEDLWAGWQGVDGGRVQYRKGRKGELLDLGREEMRRIVERLPVREEHGERFGAGLVPAHFKRIRWYGVFSDGNRTKHMKELGLVGEVVAEDDDGEVNEGWERTGTVALFERFTNEGVLLRPYVLDDKGERVTEMILTLDGPPRWVPVMGKAFLVPWAQAECRPRGVSIGKRKRWYEPGEQAGRGGPCQVDLRSLKAESH